MTKLIIQIPCLNEAEVLPATLSALPRSLPGIDVIEYCVIDDGSHDDTSGIARRWGVHHIVRHRRNRGLAEAFRSGIDTCLAQGADIIVNTDADGQYAGEDIAKIVAPVAAGAVDICLGDRSVGDNAHFSPFKRLLQKVGSTVVRTLSSTDVTDAVSGFRAISRDAAQRLNITTEFSYTTDMLIQAGRKRLAITSVPIRTNAATRPSRLFRSIPRFILSTGVTIMRAYTTFNAMRVFFVIGTILSLAGLVPISTYLWAALQGDNVGHVQSLVLGSALLIVGVLVATLGILADLVATNRKLLEANIFRLRQIEDRLGRIDEQADADQTADAGQETGSGQPDGTRSRATIATAPRAKAG